jgi:hypothetical protein
MFFVGAALEKSQANQALTAEPRIVGGLQKLQRFINDGLHFRTFGRHGHGGPRRAKSEDGEGP